MHEMLYNRQLSGGSNTYKSVTNEQITARNDAINDPARRLIDIYTDFNTIISHYIERCHSGRLSHSTSPNSQLDYTIISIYTPTYSQMIESDDMIYTHLHNEVSKRSIMSTILENHAMISYVRSHCIEAGTATEADISTNPRFEQYRTEFSNMYSSSNAINSITNLPHPSELSQSPLYSQYYTDYQSVRNVIQPKCVRNLAFRFLLQLTKPFNRREYAFQLHEFVASYRDGTKMTADYDIFMHMLVGLNNTARELELVRRLNAATFDIIFTETIDPLTNTRLPPAINFGSKEAILRRFPNDTTKSYLYTNVDLSRYTNTLLDIIPVYRAYFSYIECIVYIYDIADLIDPNKITTFDDHTVIQSVSIPLSKDENFQAYIAQPSAIGPEFSVEVTNYTPAQEDLKDFIELFYLLKCKYNISALQLGAPYYPANYNFTNNTSNMVAMLFTLTDIYAYGKTQYIGSYVGKCIGMINPTIVSQQYSIMRTVTGAYGTTRVRNLRPPSVITPFAGGKTERTYDYNDETDDYNGNNHDYNNDTTGYRSNTTNSPGLFTSITNFFRWNDGSYTHPNSLIPYIVFAIIGIVVIAAIVIIYRRKPKWEIDYSSLMVPDENADSTAKMISPVAIPEVTNVLPSTLITDSKPILPPGVSESFGTNDVIVIDPSTNTPMVIPTTSATPTSTVITPVVPADNAGNVIPSVTPVVPAGPSVVATPVINTPTNVVTTPPPNPVIVPSVVSNTPPHVKIGETVPGFNPMRAEIIPVERTEAVIVPVDKSLSDAISTIPVSKPVAPIVTTNAPVMTSTMPTAASTPVIIPVDKSVSNAMTTIPVVQPTIVTNTPIPVAQPNIEVTTPLDPVAPQPVKPKKLPGDISTPGVTRDVIVRPQHPTEYKIYDYITGKVPCDGAHLHGNKKKTGAGAGNNTGGVVNSNPTTEMFGVRYYRK